MKKIYISSLQGNNNDNLPYQLMRELSDYEYDVVNKDNLYMSNYDELRQNTEYLINKADIVIGIIREFNPNVYFELGYATAKAKKILLITDSDYDLPFDMNNFDCIRLDYNSIHSMHQILRYLKKIVIDVDENSIIPENFNDFVHKMQEIPNFIDSISSVDFEKIIRNYFNESGFETNLVKYPHDYGFDLEILNYRNFGKTLVEIKKYNVNNKVSVNVVQQLLGALSISEANHGIIITTSTFTSSAIDFVTSIDNKIELWSLNEMIVKGNAKQ